MLSEVKYRYTSDLSFSFSFATINFYCAKKVGLVFGWAINLDRKLAGLAVVICRHCGHTASWMIWVQIHFLPFNVVRPSTKE